ncbi:MAG: hypothetical protein ACR2IE_12965 [Candidatus Sumerlaeaceae bacterium]
MNFSQHSRNGIALRSSDATGMLLRNPMGIAVRNHLEHAAKVQQTSCELLVLKGV